MRSIIYGAFDKSVYVQACPVIYDYLKTGNLIYVGPGWDVLGFFPQSGQGGRLLWSLLLSSQVLASSPTLINSAELSDPLVEMSQMASSVSPPLTEWDRLVALGWPGSAMGSVDSMPERAPPGGLSGFLLSCEVEPPSNNMFWRLSSCLLGLDNLIIVIAWRIDVWARSSESLLEGVGIIFESSSSSDRSCRPLILHCVSES